MFCVHSLVFAFGIEMRNKQKLGATCDNTKSNQSNMQFCQLCFCRMRIFEQEIIKHMIALLCTVI